MEHTRKDWIVRTYQGEKEVSSWRIENRTEYEADGEAAADVARIECDDWSLNETN